MKNSKVGTVMHEFKVGKLKSSSGQKVTNRKQAVAIAMSEAGKKMKKYVRGGDIPDGDVQSNRNIGKRDPSLNKRKSTAPFTMDEMKGGLSTEELNKKSRPFDKAKEGKYAAGGKVKKMAFGGQTSAPRPTNPFTNSQQYAAEQAAMKPSVVKGNPLSREDVMQKISSAGGKPPYAGPRPGVYGAPKGGSGVSPGIMQGVEKRAIDKISMLSRPTTSAPTTSAPTTYKYVNGKAVPVGMKRGGKVGESKKMVKKEVEFFKKKKAPKAMIKHEMGEAKGMKRGGGKVMKFAKGGSIDGCALRGKTKLPRG